MEAYTIEQRYNAEMQLLETAIRTNIGLEGRYLTTLVEFRRARDDTETYVWRIGHDFKEDYEETYGALADIELHIKAVRQYLKSLGSMFKENIGGCDA